MKAEANGRGVSGLCDGEFSNRGTHASEMDSGGRGGIGAGGRWGGEGGRRGRETGRSIRGSSAGSIDPRPDRSRDGTEIGVEPQRRTEGSDQDDTGGAQG